MKTVTLPYSQTVAPVVFQREVAPRHFRLRLSASEIASQARAGQFVHVLPRPEFLREPLLRRAFSILAVDGDDFEILYRVEGRGTALMARWKSGDSVDVLGPLGNGFAPLPAAAAAQRAVLVGGGVGVPPLAMLASTRADSHQIVALVGARSAEEVICREEFETFDVPLRVATDDGSTGHRGLVTDLLKTELETDIRAIVYACGPLPMLRAVARLCAQFDVPCQVSLEENMPCGVGVCNGCVVPVAGAGDDFGRYRRICVEGPALWAHEIDWQQLTGGGHA